MNRLLDPSFENSTSGGPISDWTFTHADTESPGFNSTKRCWIESRKSLIPGQSYTGSVIQSSVSMLSGTTQTVMMFVNPDSASGNTLKVVVDPGDGSALELGTITGGAIPAGWSRWVVGSFTSLSTVGAIQIVNVNDTSGTFRWLVDDVSLGDGMSIYLAETALDAVYSMLVTYLATEQSQINTEKSSVPAGAIIINTADILPYSIGDEDPLPNRSRVEIWVDETRFDEWVGADVSRNQLPSKNIVTVRYTEADTGAGSAYDLERLHSRTIAAIHRVLAVERYDANATVQLITPLGVEYRNLTGDKRVRQATCKFEVSIYEVNA